MISKFHIPKSPIDRYINSIIYFKGYNPEHVTERVVPDGFIHLIFELDGYERSVFDHVTGESVLTLRDAWLAPMQSNFLTISAHQDSEMIVAQFHPYGVYALLHKSLGVSNEKMLKTSDIEEIDLIQLRTSIIAAENPEKKISILEREVMDSIDESKYPPTFIIEAIHTLRNNAHQKLVDLVQSSGYSRKQFIKLFKKYIGLTPKKYQRILRFNEILKRINEGKFISWVDVSLDCGYFDQAHFIKDFKSFSGMNPTAFLDIHKSTDRINFFPFD